MDLHIDKYSSLTDKNMVVQRIPYCKVGIIESLTLMFMKFYINKSIKAPITRKDNVMDCLKTYIKG